MADAPTLAHLLEQLRLAAERRDAARVREHLTRVLSFDAGTAALRTHYANRVDEAASFVLDHLDVDRDDNDNWIISLKGEVK